MSPVRWQKINEVFEAALERPGDERSVFITRACADDAELQQRVQAMLDADKKTELLLDRSPLDRALLHLCPRLVKGMATHWTSAYLAKDQLPSRKSSSRSA